MPFFETSGYCRTSLFVRMTIVDYLRDAGCVVVEVGDATEAMKLMAVMGVDVVFTDIDLPRQDGCDLANGRRPIIRMSICS